MVRPLRYFKPDGVYFITGRCLQGRLLLRPSDRTNAIIGGVLAKALRLFDIELFAFVFASNHFHMLLRSKRLEIPEFMQYLRGNIAKKIGEHVDWTGKLWDRRYDAEPVLDDEAMVGRLRYILAHGVKEGLVSRCQQWPGLSSIPELLKGTERSFFWPRSEQDTSASNEESKAERGPAYPLRLTPLPCLGSRNTLKSQQLLVAQLITEVETEQAELRKGKPVMGEAKVLKQQPHDRPKHIQRSPRPLCHASSREAYEAYKAEYASFLTSHAAASQRYRRRRLSVVDFPVFAYRPPLMRPVIRAAA